MASSLAALVLGVILLVAEFRSGELWYFWGIIPVPWFLIVAGVIGLLAALVVHAQPSLRKTQESPGVGEGRVASRQFIDKCLQNMEVLERAFAQQTSWSQLAPFAVVADDVVDVQRAAKQIAEFVGMADLMFIVTLLRQDANVGGSVELTRNQEEVFIEVDPQMQQFPATLLTVLAHEITHKKLQQHGITPRQGPGPDLEHEVLTDTAAVFLGLGKLMLNGCFASRADGIWTGPGQGQIVTHEVSVGYLKRGQLAFTYNLVCAMRGIRSSERLANLFTDARLAVQKCYDRYSEYFRQDTGQFRRSLEIGKELDATIEKRQTELFRVEKNLIYLRDVCLPVTERLLGHDHSELSNMLRLSRELGPDSSAGVGLRFVLALKAMDAAKRNRACARSDGARAGRALRRLGRSARRVRGPFPEPNEGMFEVVVCRNDGTKLRLPKGHAKVLVTCPQCGYKFMADTTATL